MTLKHPRVLPALSEFGIFYPITTARTSRPCTCTQFQMMMMMMMIIDDYDFSASFVCLLFRRHKFQRQQPRTLFTDYNKRQWPNAVLATCCHHLHSES
jgi:hypothetical protein